MKKETRQTQLQVRQRQKVSFHSNICSFIQYSPCNLYEPMIVLDIEIRMILLKFHIVLSNLMQSLIDFSFPHISTLRSNNY